MPVANVTVAFVNQPKEGSKKGSIKTDTGEFFGVWQEKLGLFSKGGKYTIEYETDMYQGKEYKTVKRVVQAPAGGTTGSGTKTYGGSDAKAVEMAVMGIVRGAYEGTGGLPDEDTLFTHMLAVRAAWTRAFAHPLGPTEKKPLAEELNDEIPF